MWYGDLVLLHLGLVDVHHSLAAIPRHLLFGVHAFDLDQRGVGILVRL